MAAAGAAFDRRVAFRDPEVAADDFSAGYGPATYRRSTPPDLLLDRLPRVVPVP